MSHEQDLFYDIDRDIIGPHRSPLLQAVEPNFKSLDSPPPLVRVDTSSDSEDVEGTDSSRPSRKRKRRKGRTNPTLADGVLIRALDPNQEQLASQAEKLPLESASQSEAEEEDNEAQRAPGHGQMRAPSKAGVRNGAKQASRRSKKLAEAALLAISEGHAKGDDWVMIDSTATVRDEISSPRPPDAASGTKEAELPKPAKRSILNQRKDLSGRQLNTLPPPLSEDLRLNLTPGSTRDEEEEDSIIKSPALGRFAISPPDAPPDVILPAIQQRSPPRSLPAGSPDRRQTLPNIKTAIGYIHESGLTAFMSPGRPPSGQLAPYASPASYSAMSPPGPPSHSYWRTTMRESNNSSSSEYTSSSAATSTPASSITMASPSASNLSTLTSVPEPEPENIPRDTAKDAEEAEEAEAGSEDESSEDSESSDPSAHYAAGEYKCTHPGCKAVPFHTQYLLNSHMNVHSNTRTHFCPQKGCPRGPGGEGFKRKNEMIR